jgi:hypothetical protein
MLLHLLPELDDRAARGASGAMVENNRRPVDLRLLWEWS